MKKSRVFASQIRSSTCDENSALYSYQSSFLKSLEYSMEVTRFTEEEWSEHQRITYVALMVLGIDGMQRLARACLLEGVVELV